ncbi:Mbeg1-like protein [Ornithinibacillus scapharcae]|uniref:Mbeg1-like protein n=1 Tax=Ornithinibacillus scapharcae TaxID=1147159 RepID=UPI000225B3F6|nr:Mbeg1-like protein [Ornithinibacillus scapharcae]
MKGYKRRILVCFSILLFLTQVFNVLEVQAVESWSGDSWKGNSWKGTPWDASDFQWEGEAWEGDSWKGKAWDSNSTDIEPWGRNDAVWGNGPRPEHATGSDPWYENPEADNHEEDLEKLCLPGLETGDGSCEGNGSSKNPDMTTEEKIDNIVEQFEKDYANILPPDFFPFKKKRKEILDKIRQEATNYTERPHGTAQDVDIPENVMATLAEIGYSDEHLANSKEKKDKFLAEYGWEESDSVDNQDTGFNARTYNNLTEDKITISFGGTEYASNLKDLGTDGKLAIGKNNDQFNEAVEYVEKMMKLYPDKEIVLTGHSLGGAIAQYVALKTKIPAVTYNAPGIATRDYGLFEDPLLAIISEDENVSMGEKYFNYHGLFGDLTVNHVMEKDEIGTYQIHVGTTYTYTEDGTVICLDQYSDEARKKDKSIGKIIDTGKDIYNKTPYHGVKNFKDIMVEC